MRPNRSVEMPPTKPEATPSRATPTAMLRQEPPTAGRAASRPSAATTGTKSISASPQLKIMASAFRCLPAAIQRAHGLAAFLVQRAEQVVNPALGAVKFRHARGRRLAQAAERRHRGHGFADRS